MFQDTRDPFLQDGDPFLDTEAFPTNASGRLTQPDYITKEGGRLAKMVAAGNYLDYSQGDPRIAGAGTGAHGASQITVVPQSEAPYNVNQWQPQFFEQSSWNQTPDDLRNQLELDVLRERAALNRAQTEQLGLESQPRVNLLEARTAAAGAHDRYRESQDAQTLQHTAGFLDHLLSPDAPGINDPNYDNYVLQGLRNNPRFAETVGGREMLNQIGKSRDTHVQIADLLKNVPDNYDVTGIELGSGKQSHINVKPKDRIAEADLMKGYRLTPEQVTNPIALRVGNLDATNRFTGDNRGSVVRFLNEKGEPITMTTQEYERFGGKYSPQTAAARAAKASPEPTKGKSKYAGLYEGK
jgi:hypothetical protein